MLDRPARGAAWEDETFDLITCLDVIEHTPDDRVTLRELHRVTRPGGYLLVTVPAYQALWSQHDVANHHFRRYNAPHARAAPRASRLDGDADDLVQQPAARARRRRPAGPAPPARADGDYKPDLTLGPAWLNRVLEQPLALEARWLARGRTLPGRAVAAGGAQRPRGARDVCAGARVATR